MAEKTSPLSAAYAFDNEEANQKYQEAYAKLLSAIDERQQKPMFDPTWLAAAQGFLTPNKTGSFFESLGNVAGNVNKAQQDEQARAQELARMRLELAGMGVQQANQQSAMKMYKEGAETPPAAAPGAPPQGAPAAQSQSDFVLKSMGIEDQGVQVAPAVPLIPEKQFIASQLLKGGSVPDAKIAYDKYVRDDIKLSQNGMLYQGSTGKLFDMPDPTPVSVPFLSLNGEPFQITKTQARKLDQITTSGDNNARIAYENKLRGIQAPKPTTPPLPAAPLNEGVTTASVAAPKVSASPPVTQPAAPLKAPPASVSAAPPTTGAPSPVAPPSAPPPPPPAATPAPQGMKSPAQLAREKAKEDQDVAIAQATAIKQAESNIAAEAETKKANKKDEQETIVEIKKAARNQVNIADQFAKLVTEYPNAIGTAAKPGFLSAGITVLESGAQIGGESAKASALQEAVTKLRGTPEELSARRVMMGLAAEYLFNLRSLAKGQGTITDYETQILSRIGPGIEDDPKTARFKAAVMKMHGEAEIARANEYNEWKNRNQGKGWKDYLGSKEHDEFAAKYDQSLAKAYDIYLGKKPKAAQPIAQPATQPASNPALDFARSLKGKP